MVLDLGPKLGLVRLRVRVGILVSGMRDHYVYMWKKSLLILLSSSAFSEDDTFLLTA
jgi:hypothetical protein